MYLVEAYSEFIDGDRKRCENRFYKFKTKNEALDFLDFCEEIKEDTKYTLYSLLKLDIIKCI
jgi:hypothetical protein